MEETIVGELNQTYERYVFNLQAQKSIDEFVTELKNLAKSGNFCKCMHDSLIRDCIVMGINCKESRKKLLQVKKLSLSACIDICKCSEATAKHMKDISGASSFQSKVHKIARAQKSQKYRPPPTMSSSPAHKPTLEAKFCGKTHIMVKSKCPAYGRKCKLDRKSVV
jgi:hypothetical protein